MTYYRIGMDALALAEMVCARMCHDFAGPLGTLSAALDMMASGSASAREAVPLCTDSVDAMARRLHLLRAAWAGESGALGMARVRDLAASLPSRVTAHIVRDPPGDLNGDEARIVLNLLLLGTEGLPGDGGIVLLIRRGVIHGMLQGHRAAWPVPPGSGQAVMTEALAHQAGLQLQLSAGPAAPGR